MKTDAVAAQDVSSLEVPAFLIAQIAAAEELGDERLIEQVAAAIGTSSPTTEELSRTLVRVRLAAARGRKLLDQKRSASARARE